MERKEKAKRKKKSSKSKLILVIILIFLLIISFVLIKRRRRDDFTSAYRGRYTIASSNLKRMNHVNQNFIMDNNYEIGQKYIEKDFYRWNDMTEMAFDKYLSLVLEQYLSDKKVKTDDLSISIIALETGNKFGLNDKNERKYSQIDNLLVNMSVMRMIENKTIGSDEKVSVLQGDLSESSSYFSKKSVGLTFDIKEIMKLSLAKNDQTAENMLRRLISDKTKMKFDSFLKREFNLNKENGTLNTSETINIARELNRYKNTYRDLTAEMPNKKEISSFIKFIVNDEHQNYYIENEEYYYDLGYIKGASQYIYSIYMDKPDPQILNEVGDLLDRKINEYFLLKNT